MAIPTIKLNSGQAMPIVGVGTWKVPNDVCAEYVYNTIKLGYRLIDCACDYGNEVECGQGVAHAIKDGIVKREDLFIVSKLWNSFHEKERVEPECKKQLQDWGLDYFDLYLMHFPVSLKYVDPSVRYPPAWLDENNQLSPGSTTVQETWQAMESLVDKGLAKSIGISNINGGLLLDLLRYARIKPATLQIEHHPYLTSLGLVKLAQENDIAVTAYSSFGPASFIELDMKAAKNAQPLLQHPTIKKVADKHGKSTAQVLLRWSTQRNIAVIPKSDSMEFLKEDLESMNFDLGQDEIDEISDLNRYLRFNDPVNYRFNQPIWV